METLIFTLHIVLWPLCLTIIGLILLQGGAGDISSAFGGGGQLDSTLGVGAGRKMAKLTGWLSAIFLAMVTFLAIPHKGSLGGGSADHPAIVAPNPAKVESEMKAPAGSAEAKAADAKDGSVAPVLVTPAEPTKDQLSPTLAPDAAPAKPATDGAAKPADAAPALPADGKPADATTSAPAPVPADGAKPADAKPAEGSAATAPAPAAPAPTPVPADPVAPAPAK